MSFTTLRRRKHKSLEVLSKGKENVDSLLMQASQVYSATSHWQSQVDAAEGAKQEAVSLLDSVEGDLQVKYAHKLYGKCIEYQGNNKTFFI